MDTEDGSQLAADETSFVQVLERVSDIVDQEQINTVPSLVIPGVDADRLAEMMAKYEHSLIENSGKLKTMIDDLATNPSNDKLQSEAKRLTHSMKGASGTYGFSLVMDITTEVETLLNSSTPLNSKDLRTLGYHVDALFLIARKRLFGDGGKAGRILLQGLKDFS